MRSPADSRPVEERADVEGAIRMKNITKAEGDHPEKRGGSKWLGNTIKARSWAQREQAE